MDSDASKEESRYRQVLFIICRSTRIVGLDSELIWTGGLEAEPSPQRGIYSSTKAMLALAHLTITDKIR